MSITSDEWEDIKKTISIGAKVRCTVQCHKPFGVFVAIENTTAIGLIERIQMDLAGYCTPVDYPPLHSQVTATVVGFRDWSRQVELAMPPKGVLPGV